MRKEPDTILLVEDDEPSRRLVRAVLRHRGFRIREAADKEGARAVLADIVPGVVLMDIRLNGSDGIELTRELRSDPELAQVPVVAITAQALKDDRERILQAGFDMYIPKPIDTRLLRNVVEQFVEASRHRNQ